MINISLGGGRCIILWETGNVCCLRFCHIIQCVCVRAIAALPLLLQLRVVGMRWGKVVTAAAAAALQQTASLRRHAKAAVATGSNGFDLRFGYLIWCV